MKTYLLMAGFDYYPSRGCGDWVACFPTKDEAEKLVKIGIYNSYEVNGNEYDWYEIIDLKDWIL